MSRDTLEYMTRFQCIAARCEDSCCAGMVIPISDAERGILLATFNGQPEERAKVVELAEVREGYQPLPRSGSPARSARHGAILASALEQLQEHRRTLSARLWPFLELGLERFWINDWYRGPFITSPSLSAHAFAMLLRASILNFLLVGHPVIAAVGRIRASRELAPREQALLEQAFVDTVQTFAKYIERSPALIATLESQGSAKPLGIDRITRAGLFAVTC